MGGIIAVEIRVLGDPVLRKKAGKVKAFDEELRRLVARMFRVMREGGETEGVGLAAPQIGVSLRVFVMDYGGVSRAMINPVCQAASGDLAEGEEGCLSVPGVYGPVLRPSWIVVKYMDVAGRQHVERFEDFLARIVCHEMDHLDGVLFIDKIVDWSRVDVKPFAMKYPAVVRLLEEKGVL